MRRSFFTSSAVTFAAGVGLVFAVASGGPYTPLQDPDFDPNHQCSYCHTPHGSGGPSLLIAEDVEILCLTCHGPGGTSPLKADVHLVDGYRFTCVDCHDPHDGPMNWLGNQNIRMVGTIQDDTWLARINTPNSGVREVVFESRGTNVGDPSLHSFADGDEDGNGYYDGICETCHTTTRHHRNNDSGGHGHHTGETCTRCHEHIDGFLRN